MMAIADKDFKDLYARIQPQLQQLPTRGNGLSEHLLGRG